MRILVQRVSEAKVVVDEQIIGQIGLGFLVFLGIEAVDTEDDIAWLTTKFAKMRVFSDADGKMNEDLSSIGGEVLVVSQFTLHASTKKGNRPSFIRAARPEIAIPLYEKFLSALEAALGRPVQSGEFGADMKVHLINDGPVTIWMDSQNRE